MPLSTSGRPPETQAIRAIHTALDCGATLIDTADVYCLDDGDIGHNERLIAQALKSWPGSKDGVIVATKGGLTRPGGRWEQNGHPDHLRRAGERSLEAIATGVVDHCAAKGIEFLAYSPAGGSRLNLKLPGHPVLGPIARRLNVSPHAVALAWVLAQGPTVIPIPGGRTPEHVRDAMTAGEVSLSPEDIEAIDRAAFPTG